MKSSRRQFLQGVGTLAIYFVLPACSTRESAAGSGQAILGNRLVVKASGEIKLMLGKVEFGQGIGTALAQIAAEELDVDFSRIRVVAVDTDFSPDEFYTFGSVSIQQGGPPTRRAGAAAKEHLLRRAAEQLNVAIESLSVVDGEIYSENKATGISYWQLIGDEQINVDVIVQTTSKDGFTDVSFTVARADRHRGSQQDGRRCGAADRLTARNPALGAARGPRRNVSLPAF